MTARRRNRTGYSENAARLIRSGVDSTAGLDALDIASIAFVGDPQRGQIQELLDRALGRLRYPLTNKSYGLAGDTLVAVRKDAARRGLAGVTEITMLELIAMKDDWAADVSFEAAVHHAAVHLERSAGPLPVGELVDPLPPA